MAVLPELREEHYDDIIEEAYTKLKENSYGVTTGSTDLEYLVMQMTRNYLQRMIDHEEYLGAGTSDV